MSAASVGVMLTEFCRMELPWKEKAKGKRLESEEEE